MYIYKEKFENQIQENMSYTQYRKWSNKKFSNGSDGKQKLITMKSNQQPMPDFEEWPVTTTVLHLVLTNQIK